MTGPRPRRDTDHPGPIVMLGGAVSPAGAALAAFTSLCGGRRGGHIVGITTASSDPAGAARQWRRDFLAAGCHNVDFPVVATRGDAGNQRVADAVESADGIFLGGGDQVKLVSVLAGTALESALRAAHARGAVVCGTSAGSAALGQTTLAGNETDETGQLVEQYIGPGLGLVGHATVVDTHFSERRRLYRLFVALAEFPELLGLGIDEDTALVVRGDVADVVGVGGVTFVDGRGARYSNAGSRRDGAPLTLSGVRVGIAGAGYSLDLARRELIVPPALLGGAGTAGGEIARRD